MCSQRLSTGRSKEQEEEEQQSERRAGWLCRWLQGSGILPEDSLACRRRITAHCLADSAFIAEVVRGLCPTTHTTRASIVGEEAPDAEVAAACLAAVFQDVYSVAMDADALVQCALKAGEADMEPLGDIVQLWQHILTYAVCCESKQRHIDVIMHLPEDLQAGLMELIEAVERRLEAHRASATSASRPAVRGARVSLGGARARRSCESTSGLRSPRVSHTEPSVAEGEHEQGKESHDVLLKENERLRERARLLTEQVEKDRGLRQRTNAVLDGEFETFERSWDLEKLLRERDDRIKELEDEVRSNRQVVQQARQLQDELLVAQAREAELAGTRAKLDHCKQLLEKAGDLKQELQAQSEKHVAACRERDALSQELAQLRSTGQQLDAWKAKVRDLELRHSEAEAKVRTAEERAREAEAEQQRLSGEGRILQGKLQELELEAAALREGAPKASGGGELYEPFTAELREHMQSLESRNAVLEQQLTEEGSQRVAALVVEGETLRGLRDHWERAAREASDKLDTTEECLADATGQLERLEEAHASQAAHLDRVQRCLDEERSRAEAAEARLLTASERCAMLDEDLHQQVGLVDSLRGELEEEQGALEMTREELSRERGASAQCLERLERREAELGTAQAAEEELRAALERLGLRAREVEDELDGCRRELEAKSLCVEELTQKCVELQDARSECMRLRLELGELSGREREAQGELLRLGVELAARAAQAREAEGRLCCSEREKADLSRQLQHSRCEQHLRERSRADLAAREEASMQRQSDLLVRIEDLRQGLSEQTAHSKGLREQLEMTEQWCQQLKGALRRTAPNDLRYLEEEALVAGFVGGKVHTLALEGDTAQLRVENRRLHAQLAEQRLRGADEAKRSAQACAKLRHLEMCAEREQLQPAAPPSVEAECDALDGQQEDMGLKPAGPKEPLAVWQDQLHTRPKAPAAPADQAPTTQGVDVLRTEAQRSNVPRGSILKKSSRLPHSDFNDKENHLISANCMNSSTDVPKVKGTFIRAKRVGLIGCIG